MGKLISLLKWFDNNLIKILVIGFIILIPLYPKLPMFNVNYTYIAIRFEDLYLAFISFIFLIQVIRKKNRLLSKYFVIPFVLYWFFVFLSLYYGIYIQKTIDYHQVGFLNALRRIEYMLPFFIAASSIKSKKDFWFILKVFVFVVFLINIYALGQRFLGWPAVQTMNPEFAKGRIVTLTPEARVSSTFGGHYDFATYLVMALPIIIALYCYSKNNLYFVVFALSLVSIFFTSSRISFAAYFFSISAFLFLIRKFYIYLFILSLTVNLSFLTGDLTQRFLKTFQVKQILVNEKTGQVYIPQTITTKELPAGSFYVAMKDQSKKETKEVAALKQQVIDQAIIDQAPPVTLAPTLPLKQPTLIPTPTLTVMSKLEKEEDKSIASLAAQLKYMNTVVSDISFSTRLQVEWPRAIKAFKYNMLLGTGPSSITEATDNDFLRWLGETGLLGTLSFLYILLSIVIFIILKLIKIKKVPRYVYYAPIFSIIGLLVNATYIDVFEASKVAFSFWAIIGVFVGFLQLKNLDKLIEK